MLYAASVAAQRMLAPFIKLHRNSVLGLEEPLQMLQQMLGLIEDDDFKKTTKVVGLYGKAGIGKTTLAAAVYDAAAEIYPGKRVFVSVGRGCKGDTCLSDKRCDVMKALLGDDSQPDFPSSREEREKLQAILRSCPPKLLVLDDLWDEEQLHWLLACEDCRDPQAALMKLYPGSRLLLTSRSRRTVTVPGHETCVIHLAGLDAKSSEQLLCREAFHASSPPPGFPSEQLKQQALEICDGIPLVLVSLGGQLRQHAQTDWQVRFAACCKLLRPRVCNCADCLPSLDSANEEFILFMRVFSLELCRRICPCRILKWETHLYRVWRRDISSSSAVPVPFAYLSCRACWIHTTRQAWSHRKNTQCCAETTIFCLQISIATCFWMLH